MAATKQMLKAGFAYFGGWREKKGWPHKQCIGGPEAHPMIVSLLIQVVLNAKVWQHEIVQLL